MIRFEEVQAQVKARILDEVQARISAVNKPLVLIALPAITSAVNKGRGSYPGTDARRAYMRAYMAKRPTAQRGCHARRRVGPA
jgi:hypothetical protein